MTWPEMGEFNRPTGGLNSQMINASNKNKGKSYDYQLDEDALKTLEKLVVRRREIGRSGWDFVDKEYGFTYPEIDEDLPIVMYKSRSSRKRREIVTL